MLQALLPVLKEHLPPELPFRLASLRGELLALVQRQERRLVELT